MTRTYRLFTAVSLALLGLLALVPLAGAGARPQARERTFRPRAASRPVYAVRAPDEDPARQTHVVRGIDGADLYVETWLPTARGRHIPPTRIPTILVMTPYAGLGEKAIPTLDDMVERGFAVAQHHVRGTGNTGGCLEQTSELQIDDGARVVEYLGRDAPWSNGAVGMYGVSYDAETQISVAGRGDPTKTRYLKAIIPIASVGGQYEYSYMDGVPFVGHAPASMAVYLAVSAVPAQRMDVAATDPTHAPEKLTCQPDVFVNAADSSGDMTPFWKVRELRPGAERIRAATLMVHGLRDFNVKPITEAGFFERIPAATPHKAVLGQWGHAYPDSGAAGRADWLEMTTAWFDRYLKGIDTGVESWPAVQIQGNDGRWRAEPDWPMTGGPAGQLALSEGGRLGVARPTGATTYTEALERPPRADMRAGSEAVFTTGRLPARLEITGQPVLDLWVTLDEPDAHIAVVLEALDRSGNAVANGSDAGFRSARHLAPLVDNRFAQEHGVEPPTETPIRVPVRLYPTDIVVPRGGRLRVTINGATTFQGTETLPSASRTAVKILHDCAHPSALRFLTARPDPDLIDVREEGEPARAFRRVTTLAAPVSDAGGLVTSPVCGEAPVRLASLGDAIAFHPPGVPRARLEVKGNRLATTGVADEVGLAIVLLGIAAAVGRRVRALR